MGNTSVPTKAFTFTASTTAFAAQVNENFDRIFTELSNIGTANIIASGVNTEELAAESVTEAKLAAAVVAKLVPTGSVIATARSSAPTGWLLCDGSAVSRTTYSDLFSAISTTYGSGDGSTTFNVPNVAGRVIVGKEASETLVTTAVSGFSAGTLGATGGSQSHTLVAGEMPVHTHTVTDPGHTHSTSEAAHTHAYDRPGVPLGVTLGGGGTAASAFANSNVTSASTGLSIVAAATSITNQNAGSGSAHRNVQPSIVLNAIIKI